MQWYVFRPRTVDNLISIGNTSTSTVPYRSVTSDCVTSDCYLRLCYIRLCYLRLCYLRLCYLRLCYLRLLVSRLVHMYGTHVPVRFMDIHSREHILIWGAYWRGISSHSACVTSNWSAVFCPYKFVCQGRPALVHLNKQFLIVRLLEILYKIGLGVDMNSIIGIYRDAL